LSEAAVSTDRLRGLEAQVPKVRAEPPVLQPTHMRRSPRHLPRLLRLRALGIPYLVAKCDNPAMHTLLEEHLRSTTYDVIYVGQLGMAAYLKRARRLAPRARIVLEEHNVEWEIFERLAPKLRRGMRRIGRWEARSLRAYERRTLRTVHSTIAISETDARALEQLSGTRPVVVPTFIEPGPKRVETTRAPSLAYTGLLAWQPNALGLDWFCGEVWPRVRQQLPEATVTIAGPGLRRNPDGSLAVPPNWAIPGIRTVGYVDSLEDVYRESMAMIAPIVGGSGVRMKLLESMRAGMPTVTTTDGAAGLAVEHERELLIADNPQAFADCVVRVLSDPALRERMRVAGYAYLEAHHSREVARLHLERALSG
jgi:glycosyltransferase involved in cell wall biosynthesis